MYIQFTITDLKAIPKQSTRFSKWGNYTDPKVKAYQEIVTAKALFERNQNKLYSTQGKALQCVIIIYKKIPKSWSKKKTQQALNGEILPISRPDVDNYAKPILDAMNGVIYEDDSCIVDLRITKIYAESDNIDITVQSY